MKLKAPAKINLFLKIVGKKNGYHQLHSLFAFVDLSDEIEVKKSTGFKLKISGEFKDFVDPKNNLLTQILDYFVQEFGIDKNLEINLVKNIPVGAGLGGGSSDGAAFIKIINEIFALNLSKKEMQEISLKFGSDIAFFFENKASIVKGRGEIIEDFSEFAPIKILLVNPCKNLSTKDVFAKFNQEICNEIATSNDVFDMIKNIANDLTKPATELMPEISEILNSMKKNGAKIAKMSGSGATCFAIFEEGKIDEALQKIKSEFDNFFAIKTKILAKND
jgi:4-diphosphocytidyl-2-C-methyl-D-erythritol kinase